MRRSRSAGSKSPRVFGAGPEDDGVCGFGCETTPVARGPIPAARESISAARRSGWPEPFPLLVILGPRAEDPGPLVRSF